MVAITGTFEAGDKLRLHWRRWPAAGRTSLARLVLLHGAGDHGDALPYRNAALYLANRGVDVYGFDMRGHGRSEGERMYVSRWDVLRDDLHAFMTSIVLNAPKPPLFLAGHSLGGLLALDYALHHPMHLRGVITSSAFLSASSVPLPVRGLLRLMSRVVPHLRLNPGFDLTNLTRDQAAAAQYQGELTTFTTTQFAAAVFSGMSQTQQRAAALTLPLLMLVGAQDRISPPGAARRFFERATITDKQLIDYPDARHTLFIEPHRDQVCADVLRWITARLVFRPSELRQIQ
jgi:alpha-beta hydrolase superfamily lysophospholipase